MLPAQPVVSVYMATYNHERYISEAIEGVIAQRTDFPIELVIGARLFHRQARGK